MKALLRILILLAIFLVGFFYFNQSDKDNESIKGPNKTVPNTEVPELTGDVLERPTTGWSTYVGKKVSSIEKKLGEPKRKGPSAYGFEWLVYEQEQQYILVGVSKGKINQVYVTGEAADLAPFKFNQTIDELYRNTITDTEINITIDDNIYTLVLSEQDLQSRLLVMYKGVFAQLYFDHETKKLLAVRYIDGPSLVQQQPYDMTYVGEMIEPKKPTSFEQEKINEENAQQLFELSNIYRQINELEPFEKQQQIDEMAQQQLKNIVMQSISKPNTGDTDLKDLLKTNNIDFKNSAENIAESYSDAADAMSGFINSSRHRKDLLNENFTILGTSSFEKNYAQIFLEIK